MAKQRGIHQIKGKINNLCYYEQKYIRGGLIRRINEAMSERLKSDPAFANTRVANAIFRGASICASVLLEFFSSRVTFLFKPYRHAILTKHVLNDLSFVQSPNFYPTLLYLGKMISSYAYIIDSIVKNKIREDFPTIGYFYPSLPIEDSFNFVIPVEHLSAFCEKNKCIGVLLSFSPPYYIYPTSPLSGTDKYLYPDSNPGGRGISVSWYKSDQGTNDLTVSVDTGSVDDAYTFWIVYALPILRTQGGRPTTGKTGASCGVVAFSAR